MLLQRKHQAKMATLVNSNKDKGNGNSNSTKILPDNSSENPSKLIL